MIEYVFKTSTVLDVSADVWEVKMRMHERRNGHQYGGEVVWEYRSKPGTSYYCLMKRLPQLIKERLKTVL